MGRNKGAKRQPQRSNNKPGIQGNANQPNAQETGKQQPPVDETNQQDPLAVQGAGPATQNNEQSGKSDSDLDEDGGTDDLDDDTDLDEDGDADDLDDDADLALEIEEGHFVCEGNLYKVLFGRMNIPGIGPRTKAEICVDPASQKYLVEKCVGTAIKLVS